MRSISQIHLLLATLLFFFSFSVGAGGIKSGNWDGIKKMMNAKEFNEAGLGNLSTDELQKLDAWLLKFLAYESQQLVKADEKIQKMQKVAVKRRILGPFKGWTGKTVFRLDNGEVWKQRLGSRYAISLESPEVEIKKNLLGFYEMKIVKTGRRVGVSRVK